MADLLIDEAINDLPGMIYDCQRLILRLIAVCNTSYSS